MDFALIMLCGWVFCVSQDLWMNKAIKLQIAGRAERAGLCSNDAEKMIDQRTSIKSAIYLCIIFTIFLYGLRIFSGGVGLWILIVVSSFATLAIIYDKIRIYREVSEINNLK